MRELMLEVPKVMANGLTEETEGSATLPKFRALIRQNSEKIGTFAEDVVLPKHRRSMHRASNTYGVLALRDVEADGVYNETTVEKKPPEMQPKYFPVFMIAISAIQVGLMYSMNKYNINMMLRLGYDPHRRYEVWRFFTTMLVHTRLSHLCTNVLLQLILGVLLEIVHNWSRIAIIYIASVLGGSLFITLLSPNHYSVGASAGVYGLLFSHLSTIILNWKEMDKKICRLSLLLLYIIGDIVINLQLAPYDTDTNYMGHLGGGITGFLVSIFVLKNCDKQPWKTKMQYICVGILTSLFIIIIFVNIFAWNYYLPTNWDRQYQDSYDDFVFQRAIGSPLLSAEREFCEQITKCRLFMSQFNVSSPNN